jgi:cytochrome b pre-mRNA-processing protein 3
MAEGFFGRSAAYNKALSGEGEPLGDVLKRNLYGVVEMQDIVILDAITSYVRRCVDHLAAQGIADLTAGQVSFAPLSKD